MGLGQDALILRGERWRCGGRFGLAQGRLFDCVAASLRDAASPLRMTILFWRAGAAKVKSNVKDNVKINVMDNVKINVKSSGRGRPLHTSY